MAWGRGDICGSRPYVLVPEENQRSHPRRTCVCVRAAEGQHGRTRSGNHLLALPANIRGSRHGRCRSAVLADLLTNRVSRLRLETSKFGCQCCRSNIRRGRCRSAVCCFGPIPNVLLVASAATVFAHASVPERPKGTACKAVQSRVQIPPGAQLVMKIFSNASVDAR